MKTSGVNFILLFLFFLFLSNSQVKNEEKIPPKTNFSLTQNVKNQITKTPSFFIKDNLDKKKKDIKKTKKDNEFFSCGNIPLYFIANKGQFEKKVRYYTRTSEFILWLTKNELFFDGRKKREHKKTSNQRYRALAKGEEIFQYERDVSKISFPSSNENVVILPKNKTYYKINHIKGNDETKWLLNIPSFTSVCFQELYKNIDLEVYGSRKQLEYDVIVRPGGKLSELAFRFSNVKESKINKNGDLIIQTRARSFKHLKPVCYQVIEDKKVYIEAQFVKHQNNIYGIQTENYNRDCTLIIDPLVLAYSAYLGGSDRDIANGIAVDEEGACYVTGSTESLDFPFQASLYGVNAGEKDVFITKINPSGSNLVYSTYIGGSKIDEGKSIAVDTLGAAYITGHTESSDFPQKNPFINKEETSVWDAFAIKINPSGDEVIYSSYLGGSLRYWGSDISVDSSGAAYVTGYTQSLDFPTNNPLYAYNSGAEDAFIVKIDASGLDLAFSTYLGGSVNYKNESIADDRGLSIAVDAEKNVIITGTTTSKDFPVISAIFDHNNGQQDAFITKINPQGTAVLYSTYLGGSMYDWGNAVAVDGQGAAYITGYIESIDFPTQNPIFGQNVGSQDVFITKIDSSGTSIVYSTYLGGSSSKNAFQEPNDIGYGICTDSQGAVYVTGLTNSTDFPVQDYLFEHLSGYGDSFITKIDPLGISLIFSTYLGGGQWDRGNDISINPQGEIYVIGIANSSDFPITSNSFDIIYNGGEILLPLR